MNTEPRLTRAQLDAWADLGGEWGPFRDAWLGKGLPWPPKGSNLDHATPRGMLWPIARSRPDDLGTWVARSPTRDPYNIIAYVLGRWEATSNAPVTTAEAKRALSRLVDIMQARDTITPTPGEAAASGDGHDAGRQGTVPPLSQRLPSRPEQPLDRLRDTTTDRILISWLPGDVVVSVGHISGHGSTLDAAAYAVLRRLEAQS